MDNQKNYFFYTASLIWSYLKKYPEYFFWMIIRCIYGIGDLILPVFFGLIVNNLTAGKTGFWDINIYVIAFCAILLLSPFFETYTGYKARQIGGKIGVDFINDFTKKLKNIDISFWENKSKGQVFSSLNKAYLGIVDFSASISHQYVLFIINIVGIIIGTLVIVPMAIFLYIIIGLGFFFNLKFNIKREKNAKLLENKAQEALDGSMMEYFNNFSTVLYLDLFDKKEKQIFDASQDFYEKYKKRRFYSVMYKRYTNHQVNSVIVVALFLYLIYSVLHGSLQIGTATIVIFFSQRLLFILNSLTDVSTAVTVSTADFQRFHMLTQEMDVVPEISKNNILSFESLKTQDIGFKIQDEILLQNVNFFINKGEKIAVIGFSGSGKSTLLDVILKVIKNYEGNVFLNDINYKDISVKNIMGIFSIVPQEVQLFKESIKQNIGNIDDEFLKKLIKITDLNYFMSRQYQGVETLIFEGSTNISGGERQRLGIARALAKNPGLLILDEATASLDPKTEKKVIENIIENYPDLAIIFVTHKYSLLNKFDKIVVFNEGNIIEFDSFDNLIKKGGLFKELYEMGINKL